MRLRHRTGRGRPLHATLLTLVVLAAGVPTTARAEEDPQRDGKVDPGLGVDDLQVRRARTRGGGPRFHRFYKRYVSLHGFIIQASDEPADAALLEAAWIVRNMLALRRDVLDMLARRGVRLTVMAHDELTTDVPEHATLEPAKWWDRRARGLGPGPGRPIVSCAEENLLGHAGDPYHQENILVHEFAHAIDLEAMRHLEPRFEARLEAAYRAARAEGRWEGTYAATNKEEYWAEGVQSWFDTNGKPGASHGEVDTREEVIAHDPRLAALIRSVFGDNPWRYVPARARAGRGHLANHDPETAPRFAWPKGLTAWYEEHERRKRTGEGLAALPVLPAGSAPDRSPVARTTTRIVFVNESGMEVGIHWLDHAGVRKPYGTVRDGQTAERATLVGHVWVVTDPQGRELARFRAGARPGRAVIRRPRATK